MFRYCNSNRIEPGLQTLAFPACKSARTSQKLWQRQTHEGAVARDYHLVTVHGPGGRGTGPCFRPTCESPNGSTRRKTDQSPSRPVNGYRGSHDSPLCPSHPSSTQGCLHQPENQAVIKPTMVVCAKFSGSFDFDGVGGLKGRIIHKVKVFVGEPSRRNQCAATNSSLFPLSFAA